MKKKRVGVIGCGRISGVYRQAFDMLAGQIEVVFAVDKILERAREFASAFEGCGFSDNLDALLQQELDAVHVLTPHFLHREHVIACLGAGFNVLTEKPVATKIEDADEMIRAAKGSGKQLGVIFQNRYIEGVVEAKKLIKNGELGKITGAWSMLNWWRPPSYYQCDWKGSWEKEGGGVVIDQAIHSLDLMRYLMGCEPVSVQSFIGKRILKSIEVEDVADAAITFENGAVYSFFACNYYSRNSEIQLEISGEKGVFHLRHNIATFELDGKAPYSIAPKTAELGGEGYWGNYHYHQIKEFYDCIAGDKIVPVTPEDAAMTLQLVLDIYKNAVKSL